MPPLCLDPSQGFPTSLQSTLPGKQAPKGRFSRKRFPGCCFQDHPLWPNEGSRTGQREKSGWDAAVTKAAAGPQLGWSLKGVWALYSLPPHTHTPANLQTSMGCGLPRSRGWGFGPSGSLHLRAVLGWDSSEPFLLPTPAPAGRMSLQSWRHWGGGLGTGNGCHCSTS